MASKLDELHRAIGGAVWHWVYLERSVAMLVFDLCALHSEHFYTDEGVGRVASSIYSNLELRANISVAKALAFQIGDEGDFYNRLKPVLDHIDTSLRIERNRFVHDRWTFGLFEEGLYRVRKGSSIKAEPGTGKLKLAEDAPTEFSSLVELRDFADELIDYRKKIEGFGEEAQELYRQKYPPEE